MKKILICQHGGSGNHGCEALARTVIQYLRQSQEQVHITLYSYHIAQDQLYLSDVPGLHLAGLDKLPGKYSPYNLSYHTKRLLGKPASKLPLTAEFQRLVDESDLVIAIGGDNYCYNMGQGYYFLDRYIKSRGKKYMLLGCSIEPEDIKNGLDSHLDLFDCITVRESISYDAMKEAGMDNIQLIPDSAFLLPAEEGLSLPAGFDPARAVGLNFSPLVMRSESAENMTVRNFEALTRYILEHTDLQVALIPHVVWPGNDDRTALAQLHSRFADSDRIFVIPDGGASQLKGVISRLRFFVGARTHATIAAYSSCVPTLTLGYSVKARGIARDLFGTEEGYVLAVQQLQREDELKDAFIRIMEHEDAIRSRLQRLMPLYQQQAEKISDAVTRVLEQPPRPARYLAAYAAADKDEDAVKCASSGGVFGLLARQTLQNSGVVFGAAMDENFVLRHQMAENEEQLQPLLGSKYVQSDLARTIPMFKEVLQSGRPVLFCGTPCQTAAIRKAVGDPDNLLLADVVCHGTPAQSVFDAYRQELEQRFGGKCVSVNFKDKSTGWAGASFTMKFDNGKTYTCRSSEDPYMQLYLQNFTIRPGCGTCPFKRDYASDITLGDFWGIKYFAPDFVHENGTSMVILRTEKGRAAFDAVSDKMRTRQVSLVGVEQFNPCLSRPARRAGQAEACMAQIGSRTLAELAEEYTVKPSWKSKVVGLLRR